jgi:uncharacterized protein
MVQMASRVRVAEHLGAAEALAIILNAQGLAGPPPSEPDVAATLRQIGSVQLDTISVLARSHELVMYSRLGPVGRGLIESAYWQDHAGSTFEYWAHCACILPMSSWPYFEFRRAEQRRRNAISGIPASVVTEVTARLREQPITVTDVGGARSSPGAVWFSRSAAKRALEILWWTGDVVCARREGWKRVYDLPERAVPAALRAQAPRPEECYEYLVASAVRAMGVATRHDIANFHQLRLGDVDRALAVAPGLVPVDVEGWDDVGWAEPGQLADPGRRTIAGRTTLLSPFDSLIWDRKRMRRLFGVAILLEAYVPQARRVNGYYAMPVLSGDRLIGHVDPQRDGKDLAIKQLTLFDESAVPELAAALLEAAKWVGAASVTVLKTQPGTIARRLRQWLA